MNDARSAVERAVRRQSDGCRLAGDAPALAPHFVPGGDGTAAWPAFAGLLEDASDAVRESALRRPVQTNEVGRCAALAPAILHASDGLPLRLLEIGASGGLNLRSGRRAGPATSGRPSDPR
jgi:hypothetical protein